MEELQGWWEVPTIAHFCHVFQAAFDLFHFEIEELEHALMQEASPYCATIEQLVMRLLQGYCKKSINTENWEEQLYSLLKEIVPKEKKKVSDLCTLKGPFNHLPVRKKVDILYKLCELRLDADDAAEAIKNISSDDLRIEPIGTDSEKNVYWYFFGLRLYKEDVNKLAEMKKQKNGLVSNQIKKQETKKQETKSRTSKRFNGDKAKNARNRQAKQEVKEPVKPVISSVWSIVCSSLQDWEKLTQTFKKSKKNKEFGQMLEEKYLPVIENVVAMRERLEKKRLLELAPRRSSSRIEKVMEQRKRELAAQEEERLRKLEAEKKQRALEEENRKKQEIEGRAKRVAERWLAQEERAKRARLRELRFNEECESSESESPNSSRSHSPIFQNPIHNKTTSSVQESDDDDNGESSRSSSSDNEDSESDESSSDQADSSDDKLCDTNTNSGFRSGMPQGSMERLQFQNRPPFVSRPFHQTNYNQPVLNGDHVDYTVRKSIRTYSRFDQPFYNNNVRTSSSHLSKTIRLDFISNVSRCAAVLSPVQFHHTAG